MTVKKYSWHKLSGSREALQMPESGLREMELAGKRICISLVNDRVRACAAKCPHAGGILADGYIDNFGHIVCPVHRYRFSPENGRNMSGEGYFLKTYPVEEREDGIYIGIEASGPFGWLK